jgi:hypothetical protein
MAVTLAYAVADIHDMVKMKQPSSHIQDTLSYYASEVAPGLGLKPDDAYWVIKAAYEKQYGKLE